MPQTPRPKVLCVIPARLNSTRLPRKALAIIGDKPMVQHTYEVAIQCEPIAQVVVATDSEEIAAVIENIGGIAEMTSSEIKTGSDRCAVVAERYPNMDVIINLQGDEPFMKPVMLSQLIEPFFSEQPPQMSTLAYPLEDMDEYHTPDIVKVICDVNGDAIYFSRSPIPYQRDPDVSLNLLHHMGLYAYSRDFLKTYTQLPQTPAEKAELLEQLRAIEHGYKIRVCKTEHKSLEVNTPEELERARGLV